MIKVNLKHCGKFKNIQAHKILYWLLENNREQDLANEGQQLYLNSMIASALSLTVFNQGAIPLPLIHMKQHLCFTVARVPLWPMLPYKINALYCNALGFYSRWIFISTQKLNTLQLNIIGNSPNTAGQYLIWLSVHLHTK
jgi:hypothetical protein